MRWLAKFRGNTRNVVLGHGKRVQNRENRTKIWVFPQNPEKAFILTNLRNKSWKKGCKIAKNRENRTKIWVFPQNPEKRSFWLIWETNHGKKSAKSRKSHRIFWSFSMGTEQEQKHPNSLKLGFNFSFSLRKIRVLAHWKSMTKIQTKGVHGNFRNPKAHFLVSVTQGKKSPELRINTWNAVLNRAEIDKSIKIMLYTIMGWKNIEF